jgi:diguanylate cyclase (GGDEF)-like protein/PAS domain S-box-containing protein
MNMKKISKKYTQLIIGMVFLIAAIVAAVVLQLSGIQRVTRENLEQEQMNTTAALVQDMEMGFFSKYNEYITGLAKSALLTEALQAEPATVQGVLNLAVNSTDVDIAYVLDTQGICTAAVGRNEKAAAMVGESYEFRPYFQNAAQGKFHVGFASGVTTGEIGIYFSAPIRVVNSIVGVVVLKTNPAFLKYTLESEELPFALVSANGVIISANRNDWLYTGLYPLSEDLLEQLSRTRQYEGLSLKAEGILPPGFDLQASGEYNSGLSVHIEPLSVMGWKLVSVAKTDSATFFYPQQKYFFIKSSIFLLIIIITALALFLNYHTGTALKADLRKLFTAVEQSPGTVVMTDPEGRIEYVNPSFEKLTGYSRKEAIGSRASILKSGHHDNEFYSDLWRTIESGGEWQGEFLNRRKDGISYWESALISPVKDRRGKTISYIAFKDDITERKMRNEIVSRRARVDELTQTLNRRTGIETLNRTFEQCYSNGSSFTVGFVDIDGLKKVNDTFGHESGDRLIKAVSVAIKHHIRESDSLSRLGGDEFLLVLPGCTREHAEEIWEKIVDEFGQIGDPEGRFEISASVGFAEMKELKLQEDIEDESIPRELLRLADERMYHRKQTAKSE